MEAIEKTRAAIYCDFPTLESLQYNSKENGMAMFTTETKSEQETENVVLLWREKVCTENGPVAMWSICYGTADERKNILQIRKLFYFLEGWLANRPKLVAL